MVYLQCNRHRQEVLRKAHAIAYGPTPKMLSGSFRLGSQTMDSGGRHEAWFGPYPACGSLEPSTLVQAHKDVRRPCCLRLMRSTDLGERESCLHAAPS